MNLKLLLKKQLHPNISYLHLFMENILSLQIMTFRTMLDNISFLCLDNKEFSWPTSRQQAKNLQNPICLSPPLGTTSFAIQSWKFQGFKILRLLRIASQCVANWMWGWPFLPTRYPHNGCHKGVWEVEAFRGAWKYFRWVQMGIGHWPGNYRIWNQRAM